MSTLALWYDRQLPEPSGQPTALTAAASKAPVPTTLMRGRLLATARSMMPWLREAPAPLTQSPDASAHDFPTLAPCPAVELHFNLWRDLVGGVNFLDVGFRLSKVQDLRAFYLYVPARLERSQVRDLGPVLKLGKTLNAVFNSVIKLDWQGDDFFTTVENDRPHLTVHLIRDQDLIVEALGSTEALSGSQILFTERLCTRIREKSEADPARDAYLRIRLELRGPSKDLFTEEVKLGELFLDNVLTRQELTEFRQNEKRSYPQRIAELADGQSFHVSAVHYFLIRDFKHQLTNQHEPSRKVRRLESEMWKHYLAAGSQPEAVEPARRITQRMLIYHWRKSAVSNDNAPREGVDSFLAFASFREAIPNLYLYLAVVALGAVGSLIASAVGSLTGAFLSWVSLFLWPAGSGEDVSQRYAASPLITNLAALFIFGALVIGGMWLGRGGLLSRKNPRAGGGNQNAK